MQTARNTSLCSCRGIFQLALVVACLAPAAIAEGPKPRRARPPKWDKTLLETFSLEATDKLLAGPLPKWFEGGAKSSSPNSTSPDNDSSGKALAWTEIVSSDALENEIKALSASLDESLGKSGKAKGSDLTRRDYLALLARLFVVIEGYNGEIRWQKDASIASIMCGLAADEAEKDTPQALNAAKIVAEAVHGLVRGSPIGGKKPKGDAGSLTDLGPAMKRIKLAHEDRLASLTADKSSLQGGADEALHEAEVLAALCQAIQHADYGYEENDSYKNYAAKLVNEALAIKKAVSAGDRDLARSAWEDARKTCDACHGEFR